MSVTKSIVTRISDAAQRGLKLGDRLLAACCIGNAAPAKSRGDAACIVDGDELALLPAQVHRHRLDTLAERLHAGNRGVLLLLNHAHADSVDILHTAQRCYAEQFKVGAVVIGVENIPRDDADALASYRRVAHAPVMDIDLRNLDDLLRVSHTLVATRVAGTLRNQEQGFFTCSAAR